MLDSGAVPNVMSENMIENLNVRMTPTRCRTKVANGDSEPCLGALTGVPVSMGDLVIPLDFSVMEESPYHAIIGLPTMIKLRARPDYFLMLLRIHLQGNSKIFSYEYERECQYFRGGIHAGMRLTMNWFWLFLAQWGQVRPKMRKNCRKSSCNTSKRNWQRK